LRRNSTKVQDSESQCFGFMTTSKNAVFLNTDSSLMQGTIASQMIYC
jgi:hypothetical protein